MFPKFEVCTIKLAKLVNSALFENPVTLKNPTPPTVFAAHFSKFAQTLATKA